jgi:hypothetical protein
MPNLIYDRLFNFYDSKDDGLIDFEEFAIGVALTSNKSKTPEKLKRIFEGYDMNNDGYVERKDFLRMFKSFYSLSKVLTRDIVASLGDDLYEQGHMDQALHGRQPISAIFTSSIPPAGRTFEKPDSADDSDLEDRPVMLPNSKDHLDKEDRDIVRRWTENPIAGGDMDRCNFFEKTRKAKFWSMMTDDDEDMMIPDEEKDVGNEVLFHMAICGINELLDLIFKEKEMLAVEAKLGDSFPWKGPDVGPKIGVKSETEAKLDAEKVTENVEESPTDEAKKEPGSEKGGETEPSTAEKVQAAKKAWNSRVETVRDEVKKRGGEGRLTYEEFERIMTGPDSSRLEFVAMWTDLASF